MRLMKTHDNLIGRVVRYVEHSGDYNLRLGDALYDGANEHSPDPEVTIGSVGVIIALHYHHTIGTYGLTKQEIDEDRWIEVDFGDEREYFWREELELVYPKIEDSMTAQANSLSDSDEIIHPRIESMDKRERETSTTVASAMAVEPVDLYETIKFHYATLVNDNGHADGCFHSPSGLTQYQWDGMGKDLECAWGVYSNDCNISLPVEEIGLPTDEEREYSGGWWKARTLESINAFRLGVPAFFCYIAKEWGEIVQPLGRLPSISQSSSFEIHWI